MNKSRASDPSRTIPTTFTALTAESQQSASGSGRSLLYVPGFHSQEDLQDQYCRMLWYVHPVLADLTSIRVATTFTPCRAFPLPSYADPALVPLAADFQGRVEYFNAEDLAAWEHALAEAHILLQWNGVSPNKQLAALIQTALAKKTHYRIDRHRYRHEGSRYISLSHDQNPTAADDLRASQQVFARMLDDLGQQHKGYVFGTGPSLGQVQGMDLSDGVSIACNSMVKNTALLAHLRPRIIAMADPIFHAGFSSYAGAFRQHLYTALDAYDSYLVVPFRDYKLYHHYLPERFRQRLIGIPLQTADEPHLDLTRAFHVTSTKNILTLLLLPLACTLFTEIGIAGCDGRKLEDNQYFWEHHTESQINDEMAQIQKAHPSFFAIDYNDYYLEHLTTLERWLLAGEEKGCRFTNLTPSYIPCLVSRSAPSAHSELAPNNPELASTADQLRALALQANNSGRVCISLAQDVKDDFGHYLHYEKALWQAFRRAGVPMLSLAHQRAVQLTAEQAFLLPCFSHFSYELNRHDTEQSDRQRSFGQELEAVHAQLSPQLKPTTQLHYYSYLSSLNALEALLPFAIQHAGVRFHLNLFYLMLEPFPLPDPMKSRCVQLFSQAATAGNIVLYADTQELADQLEREVSFRLRVWPIFSCTYHEPADMTQLSPQPLRPIPRILCPSNMNYSKGYDVFISLVCNHARYVTRSCEWVIRKVPQPNTAASLLGIAEQVEGQATVVEGTLSPQAYRQLWCDADIAVLPYRRKDFAFRTSAALCDAFLFGKPVVATDGSWLGKQVQAAGIGEVFRDGDVEDLGRAIDRLLNRYTQYQERVFAIRQDWLSSHTADHVVSQLLTPAPFLNGFVSHAPSSTPALPDHQQPVEEPQQTRSAPQQQRLNLDRIEHPVPLSAWQRLQRLGQRQVSFYARWPGLLVIILLGVQVMATGSLFGLVQSLVLLVLIGHAATAYQRTASDALAVSLKATKLADTALRTARHAQTATARNHTTAQDAIQETSHTAAAATTVAARADTRTQEALRIAGRAEVQVQAAFTAAGQAETRTQEALSIAEQAQAGAQQALSVAEQAQTQAQEATTATHKVHQEAQQATQLAETTAQLTHTVEVGVNSILSDIQAVREQYAAVAHKLDTTRETAHTALATAQSASGTQATILDSVSKMSEKTGAALATAQTANEAAQSVLTTLSAAVAAAESASQTAQAASQTAQQALSAAQDTEQAVRPTKDMYTQLTRTSNTLNLARFQSFSRQLGDQDIERLLSFWLPALDLKLNAKALGYVAHRICLVEDSCSGRLATSIQDAILRVLLALSVSSQRLSVLEIGTLFGVNLAMLYEICRGRFANIHLTAIDPLEGYYHTGMTDILTQVPVCRQVFEHNMRRLDIPPDDLTLLQGLSTDRTILEQASQRSYQLLIIDGDHSYQGVKFDFEHYSHLVDDGGYLVFDDYRTADWPEVGAYVDTEVRARSGVQFLGADWRTAVFRVVRTPRGES